MKVKRQQLELDTQQQTGSKLGKEYVKAVYCDPAYLTYMQSTSCEMLGWMKHRLESKLLGEISITLDMQMTPPPPLWQKVKNKSLLMKVKEESERAVLKLNIQKTMITLSHHFMANRWGNNGNRDIISLGSKITLDSDCSHETKRLLLLGRKAMMIPDS